MNAFLWVVVGVLLAATVDWLFRFWRQSEDRQRRLHARGILKKHGYTPQLYLATFEEANHELREALDTYAFTGHIIINAEGNVVGKLCPRMERVPHLRLVVSNQ